MALSARSQWTSSGRAGSRRSHSCSRAKRMSLTGCADTRRSAAAEQGGACRVRPRRGRIVGEGRAMPKRSDTARRGTVAHGEAPLGGPLLRVRRRRAAAKSNRSAARASSPPRPGGGIGRGECAISIRADGVGTRPVLRCGSRQSWRRGLPPGHAGSWMFVSGRSFLGVRFELFVSSCSPLQANRPPPCPRPVFRFPPGLSEWTAASPLRQVPRAFARRPSRDRHQREHLATVGLLGHTLRLERPAREKAPS
jgi:hypothetical protein